MRGVSFNLVGRIEFGANNYIQTVDMNISFCALSINTNVLLFTGAKLCIISSPALVCQCQRDWSL